MTAVRQKAVHRLDRDTLTTLFVRYPNVKSIAFHEGRVAQIETDDGNECTQDAYECLQAFAAKMLPDGVDRALAPRDRVDVHGTVDGRVISLCFDSMSGILTMDIVATPQPSFVAVYRVPMLIGLIVIFVIIALIYGVPVVPR